MLDNSSLDRLEAWLAEQASQMWENRSISYPDRDGLNNNRFDTKNIPVDGAPSQTKFSVNPSRIMLSSTTPSQVGQLNTMISMDFNGENDRHF